MDAAILSPTSYNIQNWRFLRVRDPATRKQLRKAAWDQAQVEEASDLLILCGRLDAYALRPERYWAQAEDEKRTFMVSMMRSFYGESREIQRDEIMRSCGLAAQTIMLTAKALGLDSCAMVGYNIDEVAKIINLPDTHVISMFITLGKARQPAHLRGGQLDLSEVLLNESF